MIHGIARGYDAWENPDELRKHLQWIKEQNDVSVATFAEAASFAASSKVSYCISERPKFTSSAYGIRVARR